MNGEGFDSPMIMGNTLKLMLFIIMVLPFSLLFFKKAYNSTRREGTLNQY